MSSKDNHGHDGRLFLRAVAEDPQTLAGLVKSMRFQPWRLSAWMRRSHFRKKLAESLMAMRRRRRLDLELLATSAVALIARVLAGDKNVTPLQLESARVGLELYFKFFRPRTGKHKQNARHVAVEPVRSLIHPDVSPEEALKHIEALEARAGAD